MSEEGFLFNGKIKVINASLLFLIKVPTRKAKLKLYKNRVHMVNIKSFSNHCFDSASKLSFSKCLL